MSKCCCWAVCVAGLVLSAATARGQSTSAMIAFMYPPGGQRGTTVEAVLVGTEIKGATAVYCFGRGVTGKIVSAADTAGAKPAPGAKDKPKPWFNSQVSKDAVRVALTIAADAELGPHDIRLITPGGISTRIRFLVDELPETLVTAPNATQKDAVKLENLPTAAEGQLYSGWLGTIAVMGGPDRAFYRLSAKAGRTLVCQVQGRAVIPFIGEAVPGWLDACVTLSDADGKRLVYVDDFRFDPDPVLFFKVPKDGEYGLEVRDTIYRSGQDFVYRLRAGALPFITHAFPLGGRRGTEVKVALYGVNLGHGTLRDGAIPQLATNNAMHEVDLEQETLQVKIPADSPAIRTLSVAKNGLTSNAVPFAAGDYPEILRTGANGSAAQAQRVTAPVTINGRIDRPGAADYFVFSAAAGQQLVMQVDARRLASPVDSVLTLFDAQGKELAENDDPPPQAVPNRLGTGLEDDQSFDLDPSDALVTHPADSRIAYTFATAGDYTLRLRDAQDKGGDEYGYRLTIAPPRPDFVLRVHSDGWVLAQGDSAPVTVSVLRKDGFDGEISLSVQGLPPGFKTGEAVIPAKASAAQFTLTAPADAPPGLCLPTFVGTATIDGQTVTHAAMGVETALQAFYVKHLVPTQGCLLDVREQTAFTLTTDVPAGKVVEIPAGGTASVTVQMVKKGEVKGQVNIAAVPAFQVPLHGAQAPPVAVTARFAQIAADKDSAAVTLNVAPRTAAGTTQTFILTGTLRSGKDVIVRTVPALTVKVVAAAKAGG